MSSASLTILIADDSSTDRHILSAIVKQEGHQVIEASNGMEALDRFAERVPDIILMDALMPQMDGLEASRLIKQRAGDQFVPIIFLTSLQDASSLARCLENGGDDFMSKPYNRLILKAKINAFGRMRRMHDQLQSHNRQMLLEQQVAKTVFDNVAHSGSLSLPNLRYSLSPLAVFNGDTVLAERKPDGGLSLFLGDFTGHGLPAAIGAMPLAEIFYGMTQKGFAMEDVLREINAKLYTILPTEVFCCAAMVDLDVTNKMARIWVGGVPSVYLYRADRGSIEAIESSSLPLGVLPPRRFSPEPRDFPMANDDRVFLWSDGIVESHNAAGELFGEQRLAAIFAQHPDPDTLFDAILAAVENFIGGSGHDDDITLLSATMVDMDVLGLPLLHSSKASVGGPMDWKMRLELGPQSLGVFNPLPLVLNILTEVEGLRTLSGELYTVLAELFNNGLEHGVLGLDSAVKDDALGFSHYYRMREERLAELQQGHLCLDILHRPIGDGGELTLEITDSGPGFDHSHQDMASVTDNPGYSGRGLALVRQLCDELTFNPAGNSVRATLRWPRPTWSESQPNG
ncbi:ATP-binding SpoIIE family protein phosphatase [Saccharospirillum mangrovi]|uniref:ATP-binding SpoIIE family protein phosphatase n=1 Tax=Saccharospirillum mangrovi TaxID=2161747 RepID=UPI000D3C014B|nr:fused response regulator/phosphatase [Saccharospirillum mangrovi]